MLSTFSMVSLYARCPIPENAPVGQSTGWLLVVQALLFNLCVAAG